MWVWENFGEPSASLTGFTHPSWVEEASQLSSRLRNTQLSHQSQPQLCPRAEAACPRITDLLTHICSGDFMLHLYGFFGLLGTLANTELSSIQCHVLGCGLWDECDRNRNQMPLLAWRDSQLSEGDRCTHTDEAKAGRRGLSNPPRCRGDDVKPAHATQLSSWNDIAAAAFMAAGIGLAPAC